ncbi:MFS transporter [Sporanaerobium hydrogeniformans]|uniref:MFS transporter n=2 Tax=Sporanaerobium hydrogeniformans TaxID=3072179 RepID=A0AC61DFE0_9FIRM|nr:MFS transporter [Sporanaerobium hydrogeniformans]
MENMKLVVNYTLGRARKVYFMAIPENEQELKKSRFYFTISDAAAQTIVQLAGGTFLVALMAYVGISDANIGVITSLGSFVALFQLLTLGYVMKLKKYKFFVCFTALQRLFFVWMYFVPLLTIPLTLKMGLIIIFYCIAQIFVQIGTPATQDWIASLVPNQVRGRYLATKDSVAVGVVATIMLLSGMILDYFKKDNIIVGFSLLGSLILLLVAVNFICLSKMKEPKLAYLNREGKEIHGRMVKRLHESETEYKGESLWTGLKEALKSSHFRKAISLNFLWMLSFYIALPFNASYQIKELQLPYTFIMMVGFLSNMMRVCLTPKLGKLADTYGMARILKYVLFALGISQLMIACTVPSNAYRMTIISTFFAALGWTFIGPGLFGIQLEFLEKDKRVIQLTILSSLSGMFGFFISLIGGCILDYLQHNPFMLMGRELYAQQVLNLLGFIMILMTIGYIQFFIQTAHVQVNCEDGTVI